MYNENVINALGKAVKGLGFSCYLFMKYILMFYAALFLILATWPIMLLNNIRYSRRRLNN